MGLPLLPEVFQRLLGEHDSSDPGPFAPPAGHSFHVDGILTRIRIDPDEVVDVFQWPLVGRSTQSRYHLVKRGQE